jgi:hypothetical protein
LQNRSLPPKERPLPTVSMPPKSGAAVAPTFLTLEAPAASSHSFSLAF